MKDLSDTWIRAAISDATDGVLLEVDGVIVYINESYARLLGYRSSRELLGTPVGDIVDPADRGQLDHFAKCRRDGKPAPMQYHFRALRRDGTSLPMQASASVTRVPGQLLITTVVRVAAEAGTDSTMVPPQLARLSVREREVFDHLIQGVRPKEIALRLGISPKTVGTHSSRMYEKLAIRNQLDLFRFAAHSRLIDA